MTSIAPVFRSKIGNAYPKAEVEGRQDELRAELAAMRKRGRNRVCFDCGAADVSWASPKLGTFICVTCSDIHRAAGAHITCVKNLSTYLWSLDEVEMMRGVGNDRAKDLYRPTSDLSWQPGESKEQKVRHCTKLYGTEAAQRAAKRHIDAASAAAGPNAAKSLPQPAGAPASQTSQTNAGPAVPAAPASRKPEVKPEVDWLADWPSEKAAPAGGTDLNLFSSAREVSHPWPGSVPPSLGATPAPVVQRGVGAYSTSWPSPAHHPAAAPAGPWSDLMDLFPPAPAASHCGAAAQKAVDGEKDFWSSVNWDELLK